MNIKKIIKVIAIVFIIFFTLNTNIKAASINGNSSVKVGDSFTVTFDFGTNVGAYDSISVSYDQNMYEYVSGDSLNEELWWDQTEGSNGISTKTYTFKAIKEGSSRILVVAKGVTSANESMDNLGTLTAEKMVTATPKEQPVVPQQPSNPNPPPVTNNTVALNSNNFLKYLQISEEGLNPYFTRNVTDYSLAVGENVTSIDVLAKAEDSNARVEISGNDNIVDGDNIIQIKVTAQNGNEKTYRIIVTKTNNKETSNAYLENLIVENFNLDKEFQSEILEYDLGDINNTITSLNVVAITKAEQAKVEIIGADKLNENGEVIIRVTAQDGTTIREYKLKYNYIEANDEQIAKAEIKDYLKEIQNSRGKKDKAIAYLKYLWASIKKNYLIIIMYALILIEFIQIVILRRKLNKKNDNNGGDDNEPDNDSILKVELPKEENETSNIQEFSTNKIEPPQITPLKEESVIDKLPTARHGSLQNRADGIKLVDLDKDEGPQDELTFNIFENLNDEDIKRMLNDEIDDN